MNELLKILGLRYVENGLPDLYEQARMHSLTYDADLSACAHDGGRSPQARDRTETAQGGKTAHTQNAGRVRFLISTLAR